MLSVPGDGGIDTDFVYFQPFYGSTPDSVYLQRYWSMERYDAYRIVNPNPFASPYHNLHLTPTGGPSGGSSTAFFDKLEEHSSALGSAGFSSNSGTLTLSSPHVDTGVGSAVGSVSNTGKMALKVDIDGSFGNTPVSEGALQGTYTDKFKVNGSAPTAVTKISFKAHAVAPVLDFSEGDFYNYAVGYQLSVFERGMVPKTVDEDGNVLEVAPGIKEYWSDAGFYWMDARLKRNALSGETTIHIESLGDAPPGIEGVDFEKQYLGTYSAFDQHIESNAYKYTRDIAVDPSDPLSAVYDDPLMPFSKSSISAKYVINPLTGAIIDLGDIELPTGIDLELVVNFFVVAGCSDSGLGNHCEISIDGSHTAALGIDFEDPNVTLTSEAGFAYPTTVAVPEPETWALMLGGVMLLGIMAGRRKAGAAQQDRA